MKHRILYFILIGLALTNILDLTSRGQVLGASTENPDYEEGESARQIRQSSSEFTPQVVTTTAFDQKEEVVEEPIAFDTQYEKDPDLEYGKERVVKEGKNGTKTLTYQITFWVDEEIDRQLINTTIEDPVDEVIAKGTKIVWRKLGGTDYGELKYWYHLSAWATKYDGNCAGCRGLTYSGTPVKKGTCAVDPNVIPLGTNFYVPGYGICRAEDIGGAIKGERIDLGYENVMEGSWTTRWADVYLLTNAPE